MRISFSLKHFFSRSPAANEGGAVLLIVEIAAVVLILFAGLAVDGALLATSKVQYRRTAEAVATQALYTYLRTPGTYDVKLNAAVGQAENIVGINFFVGKAFLENPGQPEKLGSNRAGAGPNGIIVPGIWHFRPPDDCSVAPKPCPCDDSNNWVGPCFEEVNLDSVPTPEPNAFRADLWLRSSSPIRAVFSGAGGAPKTMDLSASATATILARHGVFLIDLSRSAVSETHVPYEMTGTGGRPPVARASEYAFRTTGPFTPACDPAIAPNPCSIPGTCTILGGVTPGLHNAMWNGSPPTLPIHFVPRNRATAGAGPFSKRQHFVDNDYRCFTVNYTDDTDSCACVRSEQYLVDTWPGDAAAFPPLEAPTSEGPTYYGPEPLTRLLRGVNRGLTLLEQSRVPGDLVGAIGFDRSASIQERTFALTDPSLTTTSPLDDLRSVTDIDGQTMASIQQRIGQRLFFPRSASGANFPAALTRAFELLRAAPDPDNAQNFVVMMSDGITNCLVDGTCGSNEASYQASIAAAERILFDNYVPSNIAFHMILVGDQVGPHTILSKSPSNPNKCLTEDEARFNSPPLWTTNFWTYPGTWSNVFQNSMLGQPGYRYYDPSRLYAAVRATSGVWGPVRNPCVLGSDETSKLTSACQAASGGSPSQLATSDGQGNPVVYPSPVVPAPGSPADPYVDDSGRVTCEPSGLSADAQVLSYMDQILGKNPYLLVE